MKTYALYGNATKDIITLNGRPIVHDNKAELEFLLPNTRVIEVTEKDLKARSPFPPMSIKDHPDFAGVRWPLRKEDFKW